MGGFDADLDVGSGGVEGRSVSPPPSPPAPNHRQTAAGQGSRVALQGLWESGDIGWTSALIGAHTGWRFSVWKPGASCPNQIPGVPITEDQTAGALL